MEKILIIFKEKKKYLMMIIFLLIIISSGFSYFKYYQKNFNKKISEEYIEAGIYLSQKNEEDSKKIFKKIIEKKHYFYSALALNSIIENDLEESEVEIIRLFEIVEKSVKEKEQKNLIKFKKALYYFKKLKVKEGNKLLNEIIDENSIWKEAAKQTLKSSQ
tara:strand:+ start:3920 stop:4402 length:483 start_codon:yes stop_codon:yes gene_type:complete